MNKDVPKYGYQGAFSEEVGEFELNYNEFFLRTYDPQIGRWTTPDPYVQFASPYLGMGTDPANGIDPSGGIYVSWPPPGLSVLTSTLASSAGTTISTISATLTTAANSVSILATGYNVYVKNTTQGLLPGGWIGVRRETYRGAIINFHYNDLNDPKNKNGEEFVKELIDVYGDSPIQLLHIGYNTYDYESSSASGGRYIRLNPDGHWVDRTSKVLGKIRLGTLHTFVDVLSIAIPGLNVVSAIWYLAEGDETSAFLAVLPVPKIARGTLKLEVNAAEEIIKTGKVLDKPTAIKNLIDNGVQKGERLLLEASKNIQKHHVFPKEFKWFFKGKGIGINKWCVKISDQLHKVLHKGPGGGLWNERWAKFIAENTNASPSEIFKFGEDLLREFNLEHLPYIKYR